MMNWKEYEKNASDLLNKKFDKTIIGVISQGEEDSTKPDIIIKTIDNSNVFFLEVKMPNAQTSQFVLQITDNKFLYSPKNRYKNNLFSSLIIEHMNYNFERYNKVSQSGIEILIDDNLINSWIVSNLQNKGIYYIFSGTKEAERIIPIDAFSDYFNAKALFRRKKSGSRTLPNNKVDDFTKSFKTKFGEEPNIIFSDNRKYIESNKDFKKSNLYVNSVNLENIIYYLSKKDINKYEIKVLSHTNSHCVIFELTIKDSNALSTYDLNMFANLIIDKLNEEDVV